MQQGVLPLHMQPHATTLQGGGGTIVLNAANDYSGFTTFNLGQTAQISTRNVMSPHCKSDVCGRSVAGTAGRFFINYFK